MSKHDQFIQKKTRETGWSECSAVFIGQSSKQETALVNSSLALSTTGQLSLRCSAHEITPSCFLSDVFVGVSTSMWCLFIERLSHLRIVPVLSLRFWMFSLWARWFKVVSCRWGVGVWRLFATLGLTLAMRPVSPRPSSRTSRAGGEQAWGSPFLEFAQHRTDPINRCAKHILCFGLSLRRMPSSPIAPTTQLQRYGQKSQRRVDDNRCETFAAKTQPQVMSTLPNVVQEQKDNFEEHGLYPCCHHLDTRAVAISLPRRCSSMC